MLGPRGATATAVTVDAKSPKHRFASRRAGDLRHVGADPNTPALERPPLPQCDHDGHMVGRLCLVPFRLVRGGGFQPFGEGR